MNEFQAYELRLWERGVGSRDGREIALVDLSTVAILRAWFSRRVRDLAVAAVAGRLTAVSVFVTVI